MLIVLTLPILNVYVIKINHVLFDHFRLWQVPYFWLGIKAYDFVAGKQNLRSSYYLSKKKALELFPMLKKDKLKGALVYYDGRFCFSFTCIDSVKQHQYGTLQYIINFIE